MSLEHKPGLTALPPELLCKIFADLAQSDLASLVQSCRILYGPARRLLFRTPAISSRNRWDAFCGGIHKDPALASLVLELVWRNMASPHVMPHLPDEGQKPREVEWMIWGLPRDHPVFDNCTRVTLSLFPDKNGTMIRHSNSSNIIFDFMSCVFPMAREFFVDDFIIPVTAPDAFPKFEILHLSCRRNDDFDENPEDSLKELSGVFSTSIQHLDIELDGMFTWEELLALSQPDSVLRHLRLSSVGFLTVIVDLEGVIHPLAIPLLITLELDSNYVNPKLYCGANLPRLEALSVIQTVYTSDVHRGTIGENALPSILLALQNGKLPALKRLRFAWRPYDSDSPIYEVSFLRTKVAGLDELEDWARRRELVLEILFL